MNKKNLLFGNPVFAYFAKCTEGAELPNGLRFDALRVRACDEMHDLFLGCISEIASALAGRVVAAGKDAIVLFKRATLLLHHARLKGMTLTLWRAQDDRSSSETSLIHLLLKKRLYARELQELLPLVPILFASVQVPSVDQLIGPLSDLVVFCTMLQMRSWPTDAPDEWWNAVQQFGLQTYSLIQQGLEAELGKERELLKIHCLFTHNVVLSIRNHGRWAGVQGLEGLFGIFKGMSTNGKLFGAQLMRKHGSLLWSGRWLTSTGSAAQAVRKLIDQDKEEERFPGLVLKSSLSAGVQDAVHRSVGEAAFAQGRFVKWTAFPVHIDDGGAERGGLKLYACPFWFGRPVYDFLLQDGSYFHVLGLFESADTIFFAGTELQELTNSPISFGMPVLRLLARARPVCFVLNKDTATICQLIPHLQPLEDDFRSAFACEDWPEFASEDRVFHHNIFITYGVMRFPDERRWIKGQ
jgi:hypothetical protein